MKLPLLFCAIAGLGLAGFRWLAPPPAPGLAPARPNILWITCEDLSAHLGCYGDPVVKTPHLDRLAREGVRYTRMFSVSGVCAPSRSAIITGMYPTSIGTQHMRSLAPWEPPTGTSRPPGVPSYSPLVPAGVRAFPEYLRRAGYFCTNNEKTDYQFEHAPTTWDQNSKTAHWRNRPRPDQPFFAIFNLTVTHESQVWMRANEPLTVQPSQVQVPPYYPDTPIVRQSLARFMSNVETMDRQVGEILQQLEADGLLEKTIIFFYSDHGNGLPWAKRELLDRGLHVPFLVRYPQQARAGSLDTALHSFVDLAPTVLSLAGVPLPKNFQGQAFLGDQAAARPRAYIYAARDRMDTVYDRVRAVRDHRYKYFRNYFPEKPHYQNIAYRLQQPIMQEILRLHQAGGLSPRQARWFAPKPPEELYDTQTDPHELNNLADQPPHAAKLAELRQAHQAWLKQYGDLGALPEKAMLAQMFPSGQPPQLAPVAFKARRGQVAIRCATPQVSLGYRVARPGQPPAPDWWPYTQPVPLTPGDTLYALAHRIGYAPGQVAKWVAR
ncbi:MAG: sulfatase [Bernardetiaceae bacterium]|nr:sulfatase [Bernardetiaceae bacterium]